VVILIIHLILQFNQNNLHLILKKKIILLIQQEEKEDNVFHFINQNLILYVIKMDGYLEIYVKNLY
jgi:hypothetical protein